MGHTHDDVDQFFSKVSHKLKKSNVDTFQGQIVSIIEGGERERERDDLESKCSSYRD